MPTVAPPGRGGGWVAVQVMLIGAILLSAVAPAAWPGRLAPVSWAVGGAILAPGVALLAAGGIGLGSALTPFPAPRPNAGLRTTGIYARVRHPMYGGGILIGLGWSIVFASLVGLLLTLGLALFADRKSRREERWLEQTYAGYGAYRRRTPRRLLPFLW